MDAADKVALIVARGRERFDSDWEQRYLGERLLERIGESAGLMPDRFTADHPDLPIRQAKDQRNWISHAYWKIDYDELWLTMTVDVPDFAEKLRAIRDTGRS